MKSDEREQKHVRINHSAVIMTTKQGKMKKKKTMFEKERHIVAIIKAKANRERVDLCVRSSRDGHASQSTSTVTF